MRENNKRERDDSIRMSCKIYEGTIRTAARQINRNYLSSERGEESELGQFYGACQLPRSRPYVKLTH
jgi:hypothetical protein